MSNFLNDYFFKDKIINTQKNINDSFEYLIADPFDYRNIASIIEKAIETYGSDEIFILSSSTKSDKSPVKILSNYLSEIGHLVFIKDDDYEIKEVDILNKIVFTTFHQSKGLERKFVFAFGFDSNFFKFIEKESSVHIPPNILYVGATRASEKLVILHSCKSNFLPFMKKDNLLNQKFVKKIMSKNNESNFKDIISSEFTRSECKEENKNIGVTELLNHLNSEVLNECYKKLEIIDISTFGDSPNLRIKDRIKLENKKKEYYENVSSISGTSITINYKVRKSKKDKNEIIKDILENVITSSEILEKKMPVLYRNIENIKKMLTKQPSTEDILFLSNFWNSYMDKSTVRLSQIPYEEHKWIDEDQFKIINDLVKFNISDKTIFEYPFYVPEKEIQFGKEINGYIDAVDQEKCIIWEFKLVKELKQQHFLQLALYMYLFYNSNNEIINKEKYTFRLYNVYKNKQYEIKCKKKTLEEIIYLICESKYSKKVSENNSDFIKKNKGE